MQQASKFAESLVSRPAFEYTIIGLIIATGVLLGLGTSLTIEQQYGVLLHWGNQIILGLFVVEALLKMLAKAPRVDDYFRDGWNVFDFLVIIDRAGSGNGRLRNDSPSSDDCCACCALFPQ